MQTVDLVPVNFPLITAEELSAILDIFDRDPLSPAFSSGMLMHAEHAEEPGWHYATGAIRRDLLETIDAHWPSMA